MVPPRATVGARAKTTAKTTTTMTASAVVATPVVVVEAGRAVSVMAVVTARFVAAIVEENRKATGMPPRAGFAALVDSGKRPCPEGAARR
jgi:hypothetical protein